MSNYSGRFSSGPEHRIVDNMPETFNHNIAISYLTYAVYAVAIALTAGVIVLAAR